MIVNRLALCGFILGLTLPVVGVSAEDVTGISYVAQKGGVHLFLTGVTHGPSMDAPSAKVNKEFAEANMVMSEFDMTNASRANRELSRT